MGIFRSFATTIIANETNSTRFENCCLALCGKNENVTFVPTSWNYDRGRDGKSSSGKHTHILAATLEKDIEGKVDSDGSLIARTSRAKRLVYCYSRPLTEKRIDELEAVLRRHVGSECSITMFSGPQLGALAETYQDEFREHYRAELATLENYLLRTSDHTNTPETAGARLAVLAFAGDESRALREVLLEDAVVSMLGCHEEPQHTERIVQTISEDIGLTRSLNQSFIESALSSLQKRLLISGEDGKWALTKEGEKHWADFPNTAIRELMAGKQLFSTQLSKLTGHIFSPSQFEEIWSALLDFLTDLFYTHGMSVISAVNTFLTGAKPNEAVTNFEQLVHRGAEKVGVTSSFPDLALVVQQAVIDMLTEHSGPAFDWFAKICERFVGLCSLGLESKSSIELHDLISRYRLVLDTDIILKFLCKGEATHSTVRDIVFRWLLSGGRIFVAEMVLEEVAYHAWISDRDFTETRYLLGTLKGPELQRYCSNAFNRAFHAMESDPKHWGTFRSQYVGGSPRDYSNIVEVLREEIKFELLAAGFDEKLSRDVTNYLNGLAPESQRVALEYYGDDTKTSRDGKLLACIVNARKLESARDVRIALLSSSSRLRLADAHFRDQFGSPEAVISLSAVSYILSLVPNVGLGAGSLRSALFQFGDSAHLRDSDGIALRVIKAADTVTMPWARRPLLRRQLEVNLRKQAEKTGVSLAAVKKEFQSGKDEKQAATVIVQTMKDIALEDPERRDLQRRLREVERDLASARQKLERPSAAGNAPAGKQSKPKRARKQV